MTLAILGAGGIAAAIFWPRMPVFTLYSESLLSFDNAGTSTAKLMVQIKNPNRFASAYMTEPPRACWSLPKESPIV